LFEADSLYADFVGRGSFYAWLASQRDVLFRDEDFAKLYCQTNGRPSVPSSLSSAGRSDLFQRWSTCLMEARGSPVGHCLPFLLHCSRDGTHRYE